MCTQAVARRLQLGILGEELGQIALAVRADARAGTTVGDAVLFAEEVEKAGDEPSAEQLVALFKRCKVGTEKLGDEDGQPLMARTVSQTGAVLASALSGKHSGLGERAVKVRRGLRGLGLAVYLTVRNALIGTKPGAMAVTAGMAAGGALLAVGLLAGHSGAELLGALLLLGGIGAAALVRRLGSAVLLAIAAAVLALLPRLAVAIADLFTDGERSPDWAYDVLERVEGVWVILVLVVAAVWLGNLSIVWPEDERPASS
jgi:hypothetical protein